MVKPTNSPAFATIHFDFPLVRMGDMAHFLRANSSHVGKILSPLTPLDILLCLFSPLFHGPSVKRKETLPFSEFDF